MKVIKKNNSVSYEEGITTIYWELNQFNSKLIDFSDENKPLFSIRIENHICKIEFSDPNWLIQETEKEVIISCKTNPEYGEWRYLK